MHIWQLWLHSWQLKLPNSRWPNISELWRCNFSYKNFDKMLDFLENYQTSLHFSGPRWKSEIFSTGNFFSEALILVSTNPQYDKILFGLQVQYTHENFKLRTCWEYVENMLRTCYVHKLFFVFVLTFRTIHVHKMFSTCSELGIFMYLLNS